MRFADVIVLLETAQLAGIATGKAQCAVGLDALGVAQMSEHLLDTPLPRCRRCAGCFVGHAYQELPVIPKLLGEEIEDWDLRNTSDVVLVELGVFSWFWACEHGDNFDMCGFGKQLPRGPNENCVGAPGLAGFETRVKASVLLACRSDKLQLQHAPVINSDQSWFPDDTGNGLSPHPAST